MKRPTGRLRPTFLLQLVVLGVSVALFMGVLLVSMSRTMEVGTVVFLVLFWFIGIEAGLLPSLLEHLLIRRTRRQNGAASSRWFVDVEAEHRAEMQRTREGTRDNPSLW